MLEQIISTGDTGIEQGCLASGFLANVSTGGTVPKGYMTSSGAQPKIKYLGIEEKDLTLEECIKHNCATACMTLIFFKNEMSKLAQLAEDECTKTFKKFYRINVNNPIDIRILMKHITEIDVKILNVVGISEFKNSDKMYRFGIDYMGKVLNCLNTEYMFGGLITKEIRDFNQVKIVTSLEF